MGECFLHGMRGGIAVPEAGTGLNILFGGERPQTAEPDTIWVNSAEASGAYVMSPDTPEGEEGLVWFKTGDRGLSVTMEGPIKAVFHLLDVYVYVSGSWTYMPEACVYKDGGWIVFCEAFKMLYDAGDLCTDVTGGYISEGFFVDTDNVMAPEYRSDCVYFKSNTDHLLLMRTKNMISLDRYSKLVIDWVAETNSPYDPNLSITLTVIDEECKKKAAEVEFGKAAPRRTDTLDISKLTGEYYIAVRVHMRTNSTAKVDMNAYLYSLMMKV